MEKLKRIIVFGGTGAIGSSLCKALAQKGYVVVVISRNTVTAQKITPGMSSYCELNFKEPSGLLDTLEGSYAVVNLCGAPIIGKRMTEKYKNIIHESRIELTKDIVALLKKVTVKPSVFINGSAIGYYGFHNLTDDLFTEESPQANEYQGELTEEWEGAAMEAINLGVRTVTIRTGIVLSNAPDGALKKLILPFYFFIGGPVGVQNSWRSWIHIDDEVGIIIHSLENNQIRGPINATSPNPLRNKDLATTLGNVLHRPSIIPVPEIVVRLLFGEVAEVITRGKQILPTKAVATGYIFKYPLLVSALENLLYTRK